ncbi:sugar transferase [Erythrobacter sp.]|jgi:exopolysaccharide biosynthesis polyprenyl glycosylphosphotransferase|uniref:sugar transferase n=1 Tax=Erythrobacter sp. TaxID=1042 RepID=UPI002EAB11BA|nr:sugar transferase [Erythrobacter sp.]
MNDQTGLLLRDIRSEPAAAPIAPSLERRRLRALAALIIADAVLLHLAFATASFLYEGVFGTARNMFAVQTFLPFFFTIALYNGTYGGPALRNWVFAAKRVITALVIAAALLNFLAFYTKSNAEFSRVAVTLGLILSAVALVSLRRMIPVVIDYFWDGRTMNRLIIDDGGPSFTEPDAVTIRADDYQLDPTDHDPFMFDRLGTLLKNQDKVIVTTPRERREDWAFLLKSAGVHGEVVSEPTHKLGALGVQHYDDQGRTTLIVSEGPLGLRSRMMKRLFDTVVALGAIIVLSPLLAYVALRIKLEDGGPVLFVQRRMGRGNKFFNMLKFRSMKVDRGDADGMRSTAREDDRVTRIGAFIRRTSIDELPQLFNILRGEMSIVGPRPHALGSRANNKYFWEVDAEYWRRHCLKPGLTGLAQVRGHRGATEHEKDLTDRLRSDLEYVAGWSLRRDIEIVIATVAVLTHEKAY